MPIIATRSPYKAARNPRTRGSVSLSPGTLVGEYSVLGLIGAGGMGEVYRARDARLGRDIAIKLLPPWLLDDPAARARFDREARAVAALNHPNVVTIHEVGDTVITPSSRSSSSPARRSASALPVVRSR